MTAKQYLSQAREIKMRLEAMKEQLAFLKSAAEYVTPELSALPKPATPKPHVGEDAIIRVLDLEARMKEQYGKLDEISEAINGITDPIAHAILVKRYLKNQTWSEIVSAMHVSRSRVFAAHAAALGEIEKTRLKKPVLD
jgi:DNA-directed RNA polymerase specialized sigma subunit